MRPRSCCSGSFEAAASFCANVGLGYLTLDRQSRTLSGGEVQRINLTTALGTSLVNTLFVLDEPSIGLHARDMQRVMAVMRTDSRRRQHLWSSNTTHRSCAPRTACSTWGRVRASTAVEIVSYGTPAHVAADPASLTGAWLSGRRQLPSRRPSHRVSELAARRYDPTPRSNWSA